VCVLVLVVRIVAVAQGAGWDEMYYRTHCRLDALCFGVLLGYLKSARPERFAQLARAWPFILLLLPAALLLPLLYSLEHSQVITTAGFTVLYLSFGGVVLLAGAYPEFGSRGPRVLVTPTRFLAWIGVYSYTIYLFHSIVHSLPGFTSLRNLIGSAA